MVRALPLLCREGIITTKKSFFTALLVSTRCHVTLTIKILWNLFRKWI